MLISKLGCNGGQVVNAPYGHRRALAAVSPPSYTHRYALCASFLKCYTSAASPELGLISVVPLAKQRANELHVELLREEGFCEFQVRGTSELYAWQASSWKPVNGGCLEARPAAYQAPRHICSPNLVALRMSLALSMFWESSNPARPEQRTHRDQCGKIK